MDGNLAILGKGMENFQWEKEFETGIEVIDKQHRELFKRVDNLALAIYEGRGKSELKEIAVYLETYVNDHFAVEERLMYINDYPRYAEHLKKHQDFTSFFNSIVEEIDEKGADSYLAIKVENEMRGWWQTHVLQLDMDYVPFIKKFE
jgi:hemerythrin